MARPKRFVFGALGGISVHINASAKKDHKKNSNELCTGAPTPWPANSNSSKLPVSDKERSYETKCISNTTTSNRDGVDVAAIIPKRRLPPRGESIGVYSKNKSIKKEQTMNSKKSTGSATMSKLAVSLDTNEISNAASDSKSGTVADLPRGEIFIRGECEADTHEEPSGSEGVENKTPAKMNNKKKENTIQSSNNIIPLKMRRADSTLSWKIRTPGPFHHHLNQNETEVVIEETQGKTLDSQHALPPMAFLRVESTISTHSILSNVSSIAPPTRPVPSSAMKRQNSTVSRQSFSNKSRLSHAQTAPVASLPFFPLQEVDRKIVDQNMSGAVEKSNKNKKTSVSSSINMLQFQAVPLTKQGSRSHDLQMTKTKKGSSLSKKILPIRSSHLHDLDPELRAYASESDDDSTVESENKTKKSHSVVSSSGTNSLSKAPPLAKQGSRAHSFLSGRKTISLSHKKMPNRFRNQHDFGPELRAYEAQSDDDSIVAPEKYSVSTILDTSSSTLVISESDDDAHDDAHEDEKEQSECDSEPLIQQMEESDALKRPIFLVSSATQFWKTKTLMPMPSKEKNAVINKKKKQQLLNA